MKQSQLFIIGAIYIFAKSKQGAENEGIDDAFILLIQAISHY